MYPKIKISEIFPVPPLKVINLSESFKKKYSSYISSERLLGIELEIEKPFFRTKCSSAIWSGTNDGSLRNGGIEFKSAGPMKFCDLVPSLTYFKESLSYVISPRCSSHVHVNVGDLDFNAVERIFTFYMHIEKDLFKFVGKNRNKNIYCIPLWDTTYGLRPFKEAVQIQSKNNQIKVNWSKYTALNFATIPTLNTIEFRHYPGLSEIPHYISFISILENMIKFCESNNPLDLSYSEMCSVVNLSINRQEFDNTRLLYSGE